MKHEYDFSKAERGKFYRKGAELRLPIYLDAKLQHDLEQIFAPNSVCFKPVVRDSFNHLVPSASRTVAFPFLLRQRPLPYARSK